jgi:hypothetical protein
MGALRSEPFARAKKYFAALSLATTSAEFQAIYLGLGEYKSRGHGGKHRPMRRSVLGRGMADRSKYMPYVCFAKGNR